MLNDICGRRIGPMQITFCIVNSLTPRSDRYVNSPYIFPVKQTGKENEGNYQLGDMVLIQQ